MIEITVRGNLTTDPELRNTQSNRQVADFSIANSTRRFNRDSRTWETIGTTFLQCSAWGDLASDIAATCRKGTPVIATGRLQQRQYTARDGSKRSVIELVVDDLGPSLRHAQATVRKVDSRQDGQRQPQARSAQPQGRVYGRGAQPPARGQAPSQRPQGASGWASSRDYSNGAGFGGGDNNPLGPGEDPGF